MNMQAMIQEAVSRKAASSSIDTVLDQVYGHLAQGLKLPYKEIVSHVPRHLRGRHVGFHASRSGACYRQVIVEVMNRGFLQIVEDAKRDRVLMLGNLFHEWLEDAVAKYTWNRPDLLNLHPMSLSAFDNGRHRVIGTPDVVLFDIGTLTLHVVDFKTAKDKAFEMRLKDDTPGVGYRLQVATYMAGLLALFNTSGLGNALLMMRTLVREGGPYMCIDPETMPPMKISVQGHVCYVNKADMDLISFPIDVSVISEAASYWSQIYRMFDNANRTGRTPRAIPIESWQCGYCSIMPSPHLKSTPAKKKYALELCTNTPDWKLLGYDEPKEPAETKLGDNPVSTE